MKKIFIITSVLLISSCDYQKTWPSFAEALKTCEAYSDTSEAITKKVIGYLEDGSCSVSFRTEPSKELLCNFNQEQRAEISIFLESFEDKKGSFAWRFNSNKSPWQVTFERDLNVVENPIQKAIDDKACKEQ